MKKKDNYKGLLGLERNTVVLHDPTPVWDDLYREEAQRISCALGNRLVDIQHIGSTAIPGIKAKPILDILVGVRRFEDGVQCIAPLEGIGYDYVSDAGIYGHYTFGRGNTKKGERRTHLVHVVEYGGANWKHNICFRDVLRNNPKLAYEYEALKIALAQKHARNRADYTDGKTAFIKSVTGAS